MNYDQISIIPMKKKKKMKKQDIINLAFELASGDKKPIFCNYYYGETLLGILSSLAGINAHIATMLALFLSNIISMLISATYIDNNMLPYMFLIIIIFSAFLTFILIKQRKRKLTQLKLLFEYIESAPH